MSLHVLHGWRGLADVDRGAAVAIGAFDGVHLGHRLVLDAAREAARLSGAPLGVITFEPHPRRFFNPGAEPFLLASPEQRQRALAKVGVERLYILPFDAAMADQSAEEFAGEVLAERLNVIHAAVGFDFTFGRKREGDVDTLRALGERFGFGVSVVERADDLAGDKLSSTAAREAVQAGDMAAAEAVLGRAFAIEGVVERGRGKGRELGFPTANIALGDYVRPRFGVYAARTRLADSRLVDGVVYVGPGAAVQTQEPRLEAWLFDFDEDLYGQSIEVALIRFLRPDMAFDGVGALQAQAARDAAEAREVLGAEASADA